MKIKHWDEESQSWVIDGASNASNLELTNPSFLNNLGDPVSIDQGFTKVNNRLSKLEQNLAWVYINGAKGGGGGTGGTEEGYTIEIAEGETVYTSTGSATLNILINSGTVKRSFTVIATDMETGTVLGSWKKYSMSRTPIDLTNLSGTKIIEISAYDINLNYATPSYITIVAGAIRLDLQKNPPKTIVRGGISTVATIFTITKSVNTEAEFLFKVNNLEIVKVSNISTSPRTLSYDLREIIFNSGLFSTINSGQKFSFEAVASTILDGKTLTSNIITFNVTVSESDSLIVVTDNITENSPTTQELYDSLSEYQQGSQLSFLYYLSYAPTLYSTFNVDYKVYLMSDGTKVDETPITAGLIPNVNKGVNNIFVLSTVNLPITNDNQYLMVELFGSAVSNSGDTLAQYTKQVYCRVVEATYVSLYANNDIQTLLAYFSPVSGFPNNTTGTWTYNVSNTGAFPYVGSFMNSFPDGVKLTLKGVNGSTSGFLGNSDQINSIPAIVLNGESYGYVEVADQMFPNYEIGGEYSFFQSSGFNISLTYKAEESSNPDEVVMGIGKYADGVLQTGFEITLEKILVKLGISGSADTIERKLPQNKLLTVDLDVSLLGDSAWYFKVFINGVLSAVTRVLEENIGWSFGTDLFIGCRNDNGVKSRFSSVSIYDLKLYTSSQSEFAIVQNCISATEQASLINGAIDSSLDTELRTKNMFDASGNCILWNRDTNSFYNGNVLYEKLVAQMDINTPYPIILIEETTDSPTDFKAYTTATFSAAEKEEIMNATFPVKVTFQNELGTAIITTPSGVSIEKGVRVGIQGTSSLSNNEKNLELYCGDKDEAGNKQLFLADDTWLPENEFTLKADVMDSAHVNNVAIGKIINGSVKNPSGVSVKPLSATPPMLVSDSLFPNEETASDIKSKIKHTSEGFPCLLFIKYAPDSNGLSEFKFCGIYNFNLGRYAYYNLGLKLLTSYTKEKTSGPTLITDYTETTTHWNTAENAGVSSFEINQNNSAQGAFQQDDLEIIKFMADAIYTSQDVTKAYDEFKKFYTQMANMALTTTQKYTMDDSGQLPTKEIVGEFYEYNPAYYNFATTDLHLKWDNACAYFILGIALGMVDSMCKNLTLRSWGSLVQYLSFYDMDTAFALNNAGQDIVEYWAHLHRWYNIQSSDSNITTYTQEKNYVSSPEVKQYYASWWNRIWEVLENLPVKDSGNVTSDRNTIEKTYVNLRTNLFPDPDKFIEDNYINYTNKTGAIMFNYDYKIKYLRVSQTYDRVTNTYSDSTDFSQLKYLHGNRAIHVKDWFKKRIMFLDGIYGISNNVVNLGTLDSPITNSWLNNKATGSNTTTKINLEMASTSKILYRWTYDKTVGSFWLDKDSVSCTVPIPAGETIVTMYANTYITKFNNFKGYPWTALTTINFPLLEELDLSGLSNIPTSTFFSGGVYDAANNVGLKNIKTLNLSRVKLLGSSYTLNVANCNKLQNLDISYSNISTVTLPSSAILKSYNLSGTNITNLILNNQSFLNNLSINDCNLLTRVELDNCGSLTNLNIPSNVSTLIIKNCESLNNINIPYSSSNNSISPLVSIIIDNCPGLKEFNISGQNNPNLNVNLVGAWNLEILNLSDVITTNILLPSLFINGEPNFFNLKSLNISRTNISNLVFNDKDENNNTIIYDYLNLLEFKDLDNISAQNCSSLTKVICANNINNPIDLNSYSFYGCSKLTRIIGNFRINGLEVFKGCSKLILNDPSVYLTHSASEFLLGTGVTNISFSNNLNSLYGCFEGCSSIIYDDFKRLMIRIGSNVTSLEATFKGCSKINNEIWRDIFTNCRNITSLKETFSGCKLTGKFYSRAANYSLIDESTWGILDYLPNLRDTESAFESTNLEWIDNNIFSKKLINDQEIYPSLVKIDHMFRNCSLLKSCNDTRSLIPTRASLNSETFFIDLRNLIAIYPDGIFSGCISIDMDIINDSNGNTLLFHKLDRPINPVSITDSIYSGINLIGEIKNNVFGGINQNISDKYYIPVITSIQSPFNLSGSRINVNMSEMGSVFRSINSILLQAISPFSGVNCIGSKVIPDDIFQGCNVLNNIESFFSGLNLDNDSQIYEFPNSNLFKDCYNLRIVRGLFTNCNKLKIKLLGDGFINCQLTDVSGMFLNSGVFGTIPYHLFFMKKDNLNGTKSLVKTITNMTNLFSGCWCLGYQNREIDLTTVLSNVVDIEGNLIPIYTNWNNHIVKTNGIPVSFKLDVSQMTKTWNYDRDDNSEIVNPAYIEDIASRPEDYDINTPATIVNPDYNPGEYAYDTWYIDGFGWENSYTIDTEEITDLNSLQNQKVRLNSKYFIYDAQQKQSIIDNNTTGWSVIPHQNYMIPSDLFRYCANVIDVTNVLSSLNWNKNEIVVNESTGNYEVVETNVREGLFGRIPCKLLNSLVNTTNLIGVFKNTSFDPFVGLRGITTQSIIRGIAYPPDLLNYNIKLINISDMFFNTIIPVGIDINPDLFVKLSELKIVSNVWSGCKFDNREYDALGTDMIYPQINFNRIFEFNTKITDASGLFSVWEYSAEPKGLLLIESGLLQNALYINNVSNMFYSCGALKGEVPLFSSAIYSALNITNGYLYGVLESNITNSASVQPKLRPSEWSVI